MSINDFLFKKRNIIFKYDFNQLKSKFNNLENVLILFFLNKIYFRNGKISDNIINVEINLDNLEKEKIINSFLIYIENIIFHYQKYEKEKIDSFLFFIDGIVNIYGEDIIKDKKHVLYLYKNRNIKFIK